MIEVTALYIAEGTSDGPLADLVATLCAERGLLLDITIPDFSLLQDKVKKDPGSRLSASRELMGAEVDVVIIHRDTDNTDTAKRLAEMHEAMAADGRTVPLIPVIPVRMTEAWSLLDEAAIRSAAGNPNGRNSLTLPKPNRVESIADPKQLLREVLLEASGATGRRRRMVAARFDQNRRRLLQDIDPNGPISQLPSWQALVEAVDVAVAAVRDRQPGEGNPRPA